VSGNCLRRPSLLLFSLNERERERTLVKTPSLYSICPNGLGAKIPVEYVYYIRAQRVASGVEVTTTTIAYTCVSRWWQWKTIVSGQRIITVFPKWCSVEPKGSIRILGKNKYCFRFKRGFELWKRANPLLVGTLLYLTIKYLLYNNQISEFITLNNTIISIKICTKRW
jgi:hypothetical protein